LKVRIGERKDGGGGGGGGGEGGGGGGGMHCMMGHDLVNTAKHSCYQKRYINYLLFWGIIKWTCYSYRW
jgi:hypothetical protein